MMIEIPGRPHGYVALGRNPNWAAKKTYHEYCGKVRLIAKQHGLSLPLTATPDAPVWIQTLSYFEDGTITDPLNVQKGICDALFYTKKVKGVTKGKGDAFTGGSAMPPCWDLENPRVLVWIDYNRVSSEASFDASSGLWNAANKIPPIRTKQRKKAITAPPGARQWAQSKSVRVSYRCGHSRDVDGKEVKASNKSLAEYVCSATEQNCPTCK